MPILTPVLEASLVADALAMPVHWIYDAAQLAKDYGQVTDLRAPKAGTYHASRQAGDQTHYGDQAVVLAESLAATGGRFDYGDFATRWRAAWAASTAYRDGATRVTLENLEAGVAPESAGSPSDDFGGAARVAALVVALADAPEADREAALRDQAQLTHRDVVVGDAACFLARATLAIAAGTPVPAALAQASEVRYAVLDARAALAKAQAAVALGPTAAVAACGAACSTTQSFPATLALALIYPDDLEAALIANVMAGGESAARGLALGMLLGARPGAVVPARWLAIWRAGKRLQSPA